MEPKVNYTAVGAFVVALLVGIVFIVFWLASGVGPLQYKTYLAYMNESVNGLTEKAPVKYNGVTVGYVRDVELVPNKPSLVRLELEIEDNIKIRTDTIATLDSQGLTGIAHIGLRGGSPSAKVLTAKPGQDYPVIRTGPSLIARLDTVVRNLTGSVDKIVNRVSMLLDDKNQKAISDTLQNLKKASAALGKNAHAIDQSIKQFHTITTNTAKASKELPALVKNAQVSVKSIGKMTRSITRTSNEFRSTVRHGKTVVENVSNQLMPQTYDLMQELNQAVQQTNTLIQQVQNNPSMLIRGKQTPKPGPGEH